MSYSQLLPEIGLRVQHGQVAVRLFPRGRGTATRAPCSTTLAEHDVQLRTKWVEVAGAVIGRDEAAIREGVAATLGTDKGAAAFFARLQLSELTVHAAMLILRQCGVPKMNYALRCTPPSCIEVQAAAFDELVLSTAKAKLLLHDDEARRRPTVERLRAPLRHGGFGLTAALSTSPAAYLGSVAAVTSAAAFSPYTQPDCPLPHASLLHGWIEHSMDALTDASPECKELLPTTAATFFQHFSSSSKSSSLQHQLSLQATTSVFQASLQLAKDTRKTDGGKALAHLVSVSAPRAWTWKTVVPTSRELCLSDTEYRISARFNLGLQPMANAAAMPDACPLCAGTKTTLRSIRDDPWHFLSCPKLMNGEISTRHDEVGRAIYRCALLMGLRAQHEVKGLDPTGRLRPDVLLSLPGRCILTDVAIVHPLAPGRVRVGMSSTKLSSARSMESIKRKKYSQLSSLHGYEQLPFVMETCGGIGPSADVLVKTMAEASEEHLRVWSKEAVIRQLVSSVAIAVQRGNALTYLEGYDKALHAMRGTVAAPEEQSTGKRKTRKRAPADNGEERAGGGDEEEDGEQNGGQGGRATEAA